MLGPGYARYGRGERERAERCGSGPAVPCAAGVSVRRVGDITDVPWGTRVSPWTVSDRNMKICATIEAWRNRPIKGSHPYVYLDGIIMKRSWRGAAQRISADGARRPRRGVSPDSEHRGRRQGGQGRPGRRS
ncbi:MAG: transposase [Hyphomicrobiaceae bacterium]